MQRPTPYYNRIAELLREKIESGEYPRDTAIPSERKLAAQYGVSRVTLRKALAVLTGEGLLTAVGGKGTFVSPPPIANPFDTIEGTTPFLASRGLLPSRRVITSGTRPAGRRFAESFGCSPDDMIFRLMRLRLGSGEPYILEDTYLPAGLIPAIETYDFSACSLYDLYEKSGIILESDVQTLEIIKAYPPISTLLGEPDDEPVFMTVEVTSDDSGRVVEYTRSYFSGKKFTFTTVMV